LESFAFWGACGKRGLGKYLEDANDDDDDDEDLARIEEW
jgi:hypothetical protein